MTPTDLVNLLSEELKRMTPTNTTPLTSPSVPLAASATPSSITIIASSTPSASPSPSTAPLSHPNSYAGGSTSNQCGSTCGIIIGSVIGGLLLVVCCIAIYVAWRRRTRNKSNIEPSIRHSSMEAKGNTTSETRDGRPASETRSWLRLSRRVSDVRWGTVDRHYAKQGYVDLESGHLSSRVEGLRLGDNGEVHAR